MFSGGRQFKYPVGVILSISGHHLVGFLRGGVWTETTPREGGLGWNFHPNIPDSLGMGHQLKSGYFLCAWGKESWKLVWLERLLVICHPGDSMHLLLEGTEKAGC